MVSAVVMCDVTAVTWRTAMHSSELWSVLCMRCEWEAMRRWNGRYTDACGNVFLWRSPVVLRTLYHYYMYTIELVAVLYMYLY